MVSLYRYSGHVNKGYKLDCCLSDKDTHVLSCSEDGHVYYWDLVEVSRISHMTHRANTMTKCQVEYEQYRCNLSL